MNPDKVVVDVMQRDRRDVVLDFLRERISKSSKAPHGHPHSEVLAFDVAGRDVLHIGVANLGFFVAPSADSRAVSGFAGPGIGTVDFVKDGIVDIVLEGIKDRIQVNLVAVRRQLHAIRETVCQVLYKLRGASSIALANQPGADQLGIGIHGNPRPHITSDLAFYNLLSEVLLLGIDEAPNFVGLNPLARQVHQRIVQVFGTGSAKLYEKFYNRILGNTGHANRRTNRIAFDQRANHLNLLGLI